MNNSSYKLLDIILIESSFKREINFDFADTKTSLDMEVEDIIDKNKIFVTLTAKFKITTSEKKDQVNAKIKMLGIFEIINTNKLPVEIFIKVNAPAIIFPFIREHLASISLKSGITPIFLQPVNFVELSKN